MIVLSGAVKIGQTEKVRKANSPELTVDCVEDVMMRQSVRECWLAGRWEQVVAVVEMECLELLLSTCSPLSQPASHIYNILG